MKHLNIEELTDAMKGNKIITFHKEYENESYCHGQKLTINNIVPYGILFHCYDVYVCGTNMEVVEIVDSNGHQPVIKVPIFTYLEENIRANEDRCKKCGGTGKIIRTACVCKNCGNTIWGF